MRAKKDHQADRWAKLRRPKNAGGNGNGSTGASQSGNSRRPLFVFNVKMFDDGLLPPVLGSRSQWPHRYVVVIRHAEGSVQGEGPLRSRLEADHAATHARLSLPDARIHLVVAPDESEEALDSFFADPDSIRVVAEEGARARDRYEEWRRRSGPVRPGYGSNAAVNRRAFSPACS